MQGIVKAFTHTLSALFFFTVAFYSWKIVGRMYGYETTSPSMEIPMYIAYLPIPVFSIFIGIRFLIKGAGFLRDIKSGEVAE